MSRTGTIAVETHNIFPIIKKWLYSDHEVFLRELVSNAVDALEKRKHVAGLPEKPRVELKISKDQKTLEIIDNGIGMDEAEVEQYIGQIAFSGASEFVKKLEAQNVREHLIGQFGLGFYSAFMVSDQVEIFTRSVKEGSRPVHWSCRGEADYEIETITDERHPEVGTRIVLHLNEASLEFLEKSKIHSVLETYCRFMRYPVALEGEVINTQEAIWFKRPSELKDEDYKGLYRFLYPLDEDPLFWIHFNLDYPFDLQTILFFPRIRSLADAQTGNVQLYCKQVFVSDQLKGIVPEFLTLLKGVIDSPEIPLNVSRSALQGDPKIKMISDHISKKVADALAQHFQSNREKFVNDWKDLAPFVKIGLVQDQKFLDKAKNFLVYETSKNETLTPMEYQEKYGEKFKDLNAGKKTFLYAEQESAGNALVQALEAEGMPVLLTDSRIDLHVMQSLEGSETDWRFVRFDAQIDRLLKTEKDVDLVTDVAAKTKPQRLKEMFAEYLRRPTKDLDVEVISLQSQNLPAFVKTDEQSRRFAEMMQWHSQKPLDLPRKETLVVNSQHPLVRNLLAVSERPSAEKILPLLTQEVYDLARLNVGELKKEDRQEFLRRTVEILEHLTK